MRVASLSRPFFLLLVLPGVALAEEVLTLEGAVKRARAHHPAVEAQVAQVAMARARSEQALAGLLPFVTAGTAYAPQTPNYALTPAFQRAVGVTGNVTVTDIGGQPVTVVCRTPGQASCVPIAQPANVYTLNNYWTANAGISWTLWDWGKSIYAYESSRSIAESARVGVITAERNVALAARLAFFSVVATGQQVAVGEESVATYRKQLEQTQAFYRAGLRTRIDVATAEAALASAELTLAQARAAEQTARAQLSAALGEDHWQGWRLIYDPALFQTLPGDDARAAAADSALSAEALRQRSEPRQLDLQTRGAEQTTRSLRGLFLPQLTLAAGANWAGSTTITPNFDVTLSLSYPLGGMSPLQVHGLVREAEGGVRVVEAQARDTRDQIAEETASAHALLAAARVEVSSARALVVAATDQRDLAIGRYRTGVGNIIELVNALLTWQTARYQQVVAGYDLASARARLQHALGLDD